MRIGGDARPGGDLHPKLTRGEHREEDDEERREPRDRAVDFHARFSGILRFRFAPFAQERHAFVGAHGQIGGAFVGGDGCVDQPLHDVLGQTRNGEDRIDGGFEQ